MDRELAVGDHVTTDGLDVRVITAKRVTPDSPSGLSYRLLPTTSDDWIDAASVKPTHGFSDREAREQNGLSVKARKLGR